MEFRAAEARYMRVSPQKARLVLNLIKGQRVEAARNTIAFTKKRVAATVGKLLQSAIDNANFLEHRKRSRRRSRQPVCEACGGERRSANEGDSPGSDGARVPLRAAHRAPGNCAGGKKQERRSGRQRRFGGREDGEDRFRKTKAKATTKAPAKKKAVAKKATAKK